MNDKRDFPAAHSMDTTWFAVDAAGHIGIFVSGEEGAVPAFTLSTDEGDDLVTHVITTAPQLMWSQGEVAGNHLAPGDVERVWQILMFLDADRISDEAMNRMKLWRAPIAFSDASGKQIWVIESQQMTPAAFADMHDRGMCLGCSTGHEYSDPPHLGFYRFKAEEYGYPPYERKQAPRRPIHVTQLPETLRPVAEARTLPTVRFGEARVVQPAELTPCQYWGGPEGQTFLASDGVTRVPAEPSPRGSDADE